MLKPTGQSPKTIKQLYYALPLCWWGYCGFQAGCSVSAILLWTYQLPGYPSPLYGVDLPQSQLQGAYGFPMSANQICWLARSVAAQAGWSSARGCELVCWEGGSMNHMSPESGDGSFCVDGKHLSWEGTGKFCTPFLLRITQESNLDNYSPRKKTKMQCMWQLRLCTRCWITSMAFLYMCKLMVLVQRKTKKDLKAE